MPEGQHLGFAILIIFFLLSLFLATSIIHFASKRFSVERTCWRRCFLLLILAMIVTFGLGALWAWFKPALLPLLGRFTTPVLWLVLFAVQAFLYRSILKTTWWRGVLLYGLSYALLYALLLGGILYIPLVKKAFAAVLVGAKHLPA